MAQMNRNVNLEEIDSDALFGIDAFKNQTFFQKLLFFVCVIAGVLVNVLLPLFFETPRIVCILIFMGLLFAGVAFGCNYTEDMTYGKYLYFFFFQPSKYLMYESTEDVCLMKKKAEEIKKEEEKKLQRQKQASAEEQRKLLVKLICFVSVLGVLVMGVLIYAGTKKDGVKHHEVEVTESIEEQK